MAEVIKELEHRDISLAILAQPKKVGDFIQKGALILNQCDEFVRILPDVKKYFYLVERRGWYGFNLEKSADIKLVDDPFTLEKTKKLFPHAIVLEFSNADFVDTDIFKPLGYPSKYTAIQIAAWEEFKRHELFVKAAALLPSKKFLKFGHFWDGGKFSELVLKAKIIFLAKKLKADIDFPYAFSLRNKRLPKDPKQINRIINTAKMGIITSQKEGVNRFKMECLSANLPFLVPEDAEPPLKKHINEKTGVLYKPTPQGLKEAILYVEEFYDSFSPREYILQNTGMKNALVALKKALQELSKRDGVFRDFEEIKWNGRNESFIWDKEKAVKEVRALIEKFE